MTAKLVLINGVPASGKSTLARAWCEQHAERLPLCLDIDAIRAMLGGWRAQLHEAGLAARDIAVAGIAAHLDSGRDVVVPQYVRRAEFIERLEATAAAHGAQFLEIALVVDAAVADARFRERAAAVAPADPHGDLQTDMPTIVREFDNFLVTRPRAVRIASGDGSLATLEVAVAAAG
jgi:predicted kinase